MQPKTMRMQNELWTNYLCRRMNEQGLGRIGFKYLGKGEEKGTRLFSNVAELEDGLCYVVDLETKGYKRRTFDKIPLYSKVPIKEESVRIDLSTVAGLRVPTDHVDIIFCKEGSANFNPNEPYVKALFEKDTTQESAASVDEIIDILIMYALNPHSLVQDLNRNYKQQQQPSPQPQIRTQEAEYRPGHPIRLELRPLQLQIKPKEDK
jgi:hypothetical protein